MSWVLRYMTAEDTLLLSERTETVRKIYDKCTVRNVYAQQAEHEFIIECSFDTNIETIVGTVQEYISRTRSRPVVIVDYLQIISPLAAHQTTKDIVNYNVRALKKLQSFTNCSWVIYTASHLYCSKTFSWSYSETLFTSN